MKELDQLMGFLSELDPKTKATGATGALDRFRLTVVNSASFYRGRAHWQDLAREYQEDHGEEISREVLLVLAKTLGYKLEKDLVFWNYLASVPA